jgi:alanine dehydrogenase
MRIGVPTETKTGEYRVALTPAGAHELVTHGLDVVVQAGAGVGSGIADSEYAAQGARVLPEAEAVFAEADLIVKVKEPQRHEIELLEARHALFTYLHLAADRALTCDLVESGATCIAYETVEDPRGRLPLLAPMSEVAGKLAAQAAAFMLQKPLGGRGVLLGGVPGVNRGLVMVIGGGVVGKTAAEVALGLGADTYIFDRSIERLRELDSALGGHCTTVFASAVEIERRLPDADIVIGAALLPGAKAPRVINREHLRLMKPGAVLADVSIDQGGCFETSRPTTHEDPTYEVDGISHYCVSNIPGAVPATSTAALTNATLPYIRRLATAGVTSALAEDPNFLAGLNVHAGKLTNEAVAQGHGLEYTPPAGALTGAPAAA